MAEQLNSIADSTIVDKSIDSDGEVTIRELFTSFLSFNTAGLVSDKSLLDLNITDDDEKIFEDIGIANFISPLIVDSDLSNRIDDSFTEEMDFVSANLKELLEKIKIVHSMENSIKNDKPLEVKTESEEIGIKCSTLHDRLTELKIVLPDDVSSNSYQAESEILPDVIKYIKELHVECDQRQELKQQIKCLFIQLIKSAVTLKRLKDVTKATMTDKSTK